MENIKIIDTNPDNVQEFGVCGYKSMKKPGMPEKYDWLKKHFADGIKIKTLYSEEDGTQGMIEYIPGEYCWRPVEAKGYLFIHCLFVGFKKVYKAKGYGTLLLNECIKDAKAQDLNGVAVVTRKGSFMADKTLFLKNDFVVVEKAKPDFELLVLKLKDSAVNPKFKGNWDEKLTQYAKGLTIIRADQCPYTIKNVQEICQTAEQEFNLKANVIDLQSCQEAQNSPCPFGTFCIVYNGKIVAEHMVSNARFKNIMNKALK